MRRIPVDFTKKRIRGLLAKTEIGIGDTCSLFVQKKLEMSLLNSLVFNRMAKVVFTVDQKCRRQLSKKKILRYNLDCWADEVLTGRAPNEKVVVSISD